MQENHTEERCSKIMHLFLMNLNLALEEETRITYADSLRAYCLKAC